MTEKNRITKIEINFDCEKREVTVTNDMGGNFVLDNIIIVGGQSSDDSLYMFSEGTPENVSMSLAGSFKWSRLGKSQGQQFFKRVFGFFIKWVAENLQINDNVQPDGKNVKTITTFEDAEALLSRWDAEDKERSKKEKEKRWN